MATKRKPPAKMKPAARKAAAKKAPVKAAKSSSKRKRSAGSNAKAKHAIDRQELFCLEYLKDLNGAQAAIRAGYSPAAARQTASELLARPEIQGRVQAAMDERAARTGIDADDVIRRIHAIAYSDPRELIELHRSCCRYCWGKDHHYQWSPQQLRDALHKHQMDLAVANDAQKKLLTPPDETGGTGFDPRRDPNPACPECFGQGEERVFPKDTRDLTPAGLALYAGVKTTKNGLEIKMVDQASMLVKLGDHLGLFKSKVELTGKNGGPVQHATIGALLDEIDGAGTGLPAHDRRGG